MEVDPTFLDAIVAVGLGLMIGLEREHHEVVTQVQSKTDQPGVRTFALLGLAGWLAAFLGASWPYLPVAVVLAASVLLIRDPKALASEVHGLTTAVAGMVTILLGLLVPYQRLLAVALAVITTLLLISKPWVQKIVPRLTRSDFTSTLQLCIALAIMLPLLPAQPVDPWSILVPQKIGLFVTLVLGVSWVGYVLSRFLGEDRSAALTGFFGGLVSSTAVTITMAQRARRRDNAASAARTATYLACAVMSVRLLVIAAIFSPPLAIAALPGIGAIGLVMLIFAFLSYRKREPEATTDMEIANPVSLAAALKWGVFLCFVLLVSAFAHSWFGELGTIATAALAGVADTDAIILALTERGTSLDVASWALVTAAVVNTLVKGIIAWVGGGAAYARKLIPVFGVAVVLALLLTVLI